MNHLNRGQQLLGFEGLGLNTFNAYHQLNMQMYAELTRNTNATQMTKDTLDSALSKKKSIESNLSEKGSDMTGKHSVMSAQTGLMFKCFDSIYGAQRILNNIKERSSVYGGSINGGMSVAG